MENKNGWKKYFDKKAMVPYLYNKELKSMLTYEDEASLKERCDFVIKNSYGGMVIWELSGDDKSEGFPLTTIIWEKFFKSINPSTSSSTSDKDNENKESEKDVDSNDSNKDSIKTNSTNESTTDLDIDFEVTSDWGSGANWSMTITNKTGKNISGWEVNFSFDKKIIQCWDAVLSSSGDTYKISNPTWGGTLKKDESIKIGGSCDGNSKNLKLKDKKIYIK